MTQLTEKITHLDRTYTIHYELDEEAAHLRITDVTVSGISILEVFNPSLLQEIYNDLYHRKINHPV